MRHRPTRFGGRQFRDSSDELVDDFVLLRGIAAMRFGSGPLVCAAMIVMGMFIEALAIYAASGSRDLVRACRDNACAFR